MLCSPIDWSWDPDRLDQPYLNILKMFEDQPTAPYSIHRISTFGIAKPLYYNLKPPIACFSTILASKAASSDKPINCWLGPNTVAQALKYVSGFFLSFLLTSI